MFTYETLGLQSLAPLVQGILQAPSTSGALFKQ